MLFIGSIYDEYKINGLDWLANLVDGGSIIFDIASQNLIAISLSLNYIAHFSLFTVYLIFNFKVY